MQRPDFKKTDDMFNRVLQRDNIAVVTLLESKATGSRLILVNVHIHWHPQYRDVKLVQTGLLVDEVDKIASRFARYTFGSKETSHGRSSTAMSNYFVDILPKTLP